MKNECLIDKVCVPCQGGVPSLTQNEIESFLEELGNSWVINNLGHLYKEYIFKNFMDAMDLANKIAIIAEQEAHHPDILISWGKCSINIWTHKIDGLTESDFILAAKIQNII